MEEAMEREMASAAGSMDFLDLALDTSWELLGLAFNVIAVLHLDADKFGFWVIFLFFLIYPLFAIVIEKVCNFQAVSALLWQLCLVVVKIVLYILFSGATEEAVLDFTFLGTVSGVLALAMACKACRSKKQSVVSEELKCVNWIATNYMGVVRSVNLLVFTWFPKTSPFRTMEFDVVATVAVWAAGYNESHWVQRVELMKRQHDRAGVWKLRFMKAIPILAAFFELYVGVLCGQYLYAGWYLGKGFETRWEWVFCLTYLGTLLEPVFNCICCLPCLPCLCCLGCATLAARRSGNMELVEMFEALVARRSGSADDGFV